MANRNLKPCYFCQFGRKEHFSKKKKIQQEKCSSYCFKIFLPFLFSPFPLENRTFHPRNDTLHKFNPLEFRKIISNPQKINVHIHNGTTYCKQHRTHMNGHSFFRTHHTATRFSSFELACEPWWILKYSKWMSLS